MNSLIGRNFDLRKSPRDIFGGLDPVVLQWRNTVLNAHYPAPSNYTLRALNSFYLDLKKAGIHNKMKSVCCFVPDSIGACTTPLISVAGNKIWTNTNFLDIDLNPNGLQGRGIAFNTWLNTGVIPSTTFRSSSGGMTMYISGHGGDYTLDSARDFGCSDSAYTRAMVLLGCFNGTTPTWDCWYNSGASRITGSVTQWFGYVSGNRVSDSSTSIYIASGRRTHTKVAGGTAIGGTLPEYQIYCFVGNQGGSLASYSIKRLSFAAVHDGLTELESIKFYLAITKLRKRLGGGFI
jgi:hypothetical protein